MSSPRAATATGAPTALPVCKPWAPPAASLAPYLEQIDANRWYSNCGPLLRAFEARLAGRFIAETHVVTAANGTLALAMALRARAPQGGLCLLPGWTFVATAHAAVLAGLKPLLCDVDQASGVLTPELARHAISRAPAAPAVIVPVTAYGAPMDLDAWAALEMETGISVIVDAAAGFDVVREAPVPVMISLHATKALGVGEGGFIATQDPKLADAIRAQSMFGFESGRVSQTTAFNAKLSEYAAAVGLAALDMWPRTRARLMRAAMRLRARLWERGIAFQPRWGQDWITTTCVIRRIGCAPLERSLAAAGIEARRWWGSGLHREPAFHDCLRVSDLAAVERLAEESLGLPFAIDLSFAEIERIAGALPAEDLPASPSA